MHGEVVAKWASIFGSQNVSVLIVDEQRPEFLYEQINAYLGLPAGFLKPEAEGSNRSLSAEEVTLLLEMNQRFPEKREWNEYLIFIRNGYIRQLTDNVPLKEGSTKLLTPSWAVAKANQLSGESKKKIKELGVNILGDIESLDTAKVPEGEPTYPTTIDISTVAQAMLVFDKRLSRKIPLPWLVSWTTAEILRRFKWGVKSLLRMR